MTLDEQRKSPGSSDRTGAVGIASPTKAEKAQGRNDGARRIDMPAIGCRLRGDSESRVLYSPCNGRSIAGALPVSAQK